MTAFAWFQVAQFAAMIAAGALLWSVRQAFRGGQIMTQFMARIEALERSYETLDDRLSALARTVEAQPEYFRGIFASTERINDLMRESREDRAHLWDELRAVSRRRGR